MKATAATAGRAEWRSGWPLLLSCAVGNSAPPLAQYTLGQFMAPLEHAYGWSRTEVSAGLSLSMLVSFLMGTLTGRVVDRTNARVIAIANLVLTGAALAAFALFNGQLWMWMALWTVYAVCCIWGQPVLWLSVIPPVFKVNRSLATAVVLAGVGLNTAFAPVTARALIDAFGWRAAYPALALIWFGVALVLVLLFFHDKRPLRAQTSPPAATAKSGAPPGSIRGLLLSPPFLKLGVVVLFVMTLQYGYTIHLAPALVDTGFRPMAAAQLAGLTGLAAIVGKLCVGWLFDRLSLSPVIGVVVAIFAAGCVLLAIQQGDVVLALAACIVFGLSTGAMLTLVTCLTRQIFPPEDFGTIFGTLCAVMAVAAGLGPIVASLVHDKTGSYVPIFWVGLVGAVFAGATLLSLRPRRPPPLAPAASLS
jgi:MFS family permease